MEKYVLELMETGKRVDERKFDEFRPITINKNIIKKAEGSCEVIIGDTRVIAGVKMSLGEPFSDTPDEGVLIVNAEFSPLAAPEFESGPPGEDAVELARVVDRGIRESKAIDTKKLCITPKEKVWCVFIDIHILNHQGNLLDAAALASLTALLNTRIPKVKDEEIVKGESEGPLPVVFKPINITVCKVAGKFLVDPNLEEENAIESKLSICVRDDNCICSLQKQGNKELDFEDIEKMVDMTIEKSKQLRELV